MGKFKDLMFNKKELSDKDVSFAKTGFIVVSVCEYATANWLGGAYLVGLFAYLGASEAMSSFIISLGTLAATLQILLPYLMKSTSYNKPATLLFRFTVRFCSVLIFFFPFIFGKGNISILLAGILYFIYSVANYMIASPFNIWQMRAVSQKGGIGKYFGIKEGIVNISLVVTFAVGAWITSVFTGDIEKYSYLIFATLAGVCSIIELVFLFFTKEPYEENTSKKVPNLLKIMVNIFRDKTIREYSIYYILFTVSNQLVSTIYNIYLVQRLGLPMDIISYRLMADLVIRSIFAVIYGRMADKIGMKEVLITSLIFMSSHYLLHIFITPESLTAILIITVLTSALAWGGFGLSNYNFMFMRLPKENQSEYMVCLNTLSLGISYLVSLGATYFLAKGFSLNLLGITLDDMKILFIFIFLLQAGAALFLCLYKKR